jgi:hypothetical protein
MASDAAAMTASRTMSQAHIQAITRLVRLSKYFD